MLSYRQLRQAMAFFEEDFQTTLSGEPQRPLIRSKELGTKMEKVPAYGTHFATLEEKYVTTKPEISHVTATTKSMKT